MKSNCHTHTVFCDGKNTAEEMVVSAVEKGFDSLGFSGHSPMDYENDWGMKSEAVADYINCIKTVAEKYKDKIEIFCGIELDADYEHINLKDFDYSIGSVHQLKIKNDIYLMDYSAEELQRCIDEQFGGNSSLMAEAYFERLADFIIKEPVDVVGHFDLITKFNEKTPVFDTTCPIYRSAALKAIGNILKEKPGMIFEVNTGAMYRKGNKIPYPYEFILKKINVLGGKITITSDAHCTDALDFAFEQAEIFCRDCGFDSVWYLSGGGWAQYEL